MTFEFRAMTEAEFAIFAKKSLADYTRAKTAAEGHSEAEGRAIAERQWREILPHGMHTPSQHFFHLWLDGENVGHLWFAIRKRELGDVAFIYDLALSEHVRGQGLGKRTMLELESRVRAMGAKKIGLHVFGHNTVARSLYESLGYGVTNLNLEKRLT